MLYTVEIEDSRAHVALLKTAGSHYVDAVKNATEELFDENHPDLSHFESPDEDGFETERSMCVDDCRSIRVFAGHLEDVSGQVPIHEE